MQLTGVLDKKVSISTLIGCFNPKVDTNIQTKTSFFRQGTKLTQVIIIPTFRSIEQALPPNQLHLKEFQQIHSTQYLHFTCFKGTSNISIFTYRFKEARPDLLSQLEFLVSKKVDSLTTCSKQLYVSKTQEVNQLLLFCICSKNSQHNLLHKTSIEQKNSHLQVKSIQDQTLLQCLQDTSKTIPYQKGSISVSSTHLRYYFFNSIINQTYCGKTFLLPLDQTFITSIEEFNSQYVDMIYKTKIIIRESYFTNYQSIIFNQTGIQDMELVEYTIARRFLTILYQKLN